MRVVQLLIPNYLILCITTQWMAHSLSQFLLVRTWDGDVQEPGMCYSTPVFAISVSVECIGC